MKKLLLGLLLLFQLHSFAQTYVPFDTTNAMWLQGRGYNDATVYFIIVDYVYINGDTLLNNITYHKIYKSDTIGQFYTAIPPWFLYYGSFPGGAYYQGAFREDSSKHIYFWPDTATTEHLMYDFNLNIGDTIVNTLLVEALSGSYFTVASIDSIFDGFIYRKRFNINLDGNPIGLSLIEGIGSTYGSFNSVLWFGGEIWLDLLCYSENSIAKYSDSFYHLCSLTGLSENEKNKISFTPFPNPANEFTEISYDLNAGDQIQLFDIAGRVLFSKTILSPVSTYKLQTSNYPQGVYLIQLKNNKTIVTAILLKQ